VPYVVPTNFASGAILTEAQMDVLGNDIVFLANPPVCSVYNSGSVSVSNATETAVTWNSENFDTDTMHSTGSNTSRITATTAGKYRVTGYVEFDANGTGLRYAALKKNGTTYLVLMEKDDPSSGRSTRFNPTWLVSMAATDYVELVVYQASGGALNVTTSSGFTAEWVSL
jgi:hypothetical protein